MLSSTRVWLGGLLAATLATAASTAGAVSVSDLNVLSFTRANLATAQTSYRDFLDTHTISNLRTETFEDYEAYDAGTPGSGTSNPANTRVGSFTGIGDTGTGHAAIKGGTAAEVRNDNTMPWGRYNAADVNLPVTGLVGGNWADSNDMTGLEWKISGVGSFNTIMFFLLDAADVGRVMSLQIGDSSFDDLLGATGRLANGNIRLVTARLSETVQDLTVRFLNDGTNDGFGIDGASIAKVTPVPVPPAALLLVTGIAGKIGRAHV